MTILMIIIGVIYTLYISIDAYSTIKLRKKIKDYEKHGDNREDSK